MDIILQKQWNYTLTRENENYFLSVVSGSVGVFEIDIQLNSTEVANFLENGEEYIDQLSEEIRNKPSLWISRKVIK